jgi:type IV pilus assembly protein PilB
MSDTPVITINDHAALLCAAPVRRLVYMVLLLAVKDRATEVQFEPCPPDGEWRLRYNIDDNWYEMVPVPLYVPISRELHRLAGLGLARRLAGYVGRLVRGGRAAQERRVRLLIAGHAVDLRVTFEPVRDGDPGREEAVALHLAAGELPFGDAHRILTEYLQSPRPTESSWSGA